MRRVALPLLIVLLATGCSDTGGDDSENALAADSPITIIHLGDVVAQGGRDSSTYRCFLDTMLHDAGVAFDFVGSRQKPAYGYDYTCPTDFDQDHEGWAGARVGSLETDMMTTSVEALQPDVALISIGWENISSRQQGPATAAEKLKSFIADLQTVSPEITLLVAQQIPCTYPLPWCTDDMPAFNDAIASFGSLSTDESTVIVVDMVTGFSLDYLRSSNLPNDAGDEFMAGRWMDALREAGVIGASD
ncbi:MAG: hypothetical protein ABFS21_12095 [Actinomycetota bacterium]